MINTNDYDDKGRCVHHPHIRLRKEKMFGRGWKVLMSACPDCCVDELRRIRLVEENNKRRMRERADRLERSERSVDGSMDASHRSGVDGRSVDGSHRSHGSRHGQNHPPEPQAYSSVRSNGSQQELQLRSSVRSIGSRSTVPPPPPPRSVKRSPSQDTQSSRRAPSQESYRYAPPPKNIRSPSQDTHRSSSRRAPSQESYRHAPPPSLSKRSPSQDSFRNASVSLTSAHRARRSPSVSSKDRRHSGDDATASLTGSEPISDSDRSALTPGPERQDVLRKKRSSRSSSGESQEPLDASENRGTIHVREMQWTDQKGQAGTYTGQVNDRFVPSGHGTMDYEDGCIKEGEWKNGRYRKSIRKGGSKARSRSKSRERGLSSRRERSSSRNRLHQAIPAAA